MTRSIASPSSAVTMKASGMAIKNSGAQPKARHYGGVGADHHQLAVGHVDHAHDAVGDGEAQRHQQQNRPDAQADEQRIDHGFTTCGRRESPVAAHLIDHVFFELGGVETLRRAEQIVVGLAIGDVGQGLNRLLVLVDDLALTVRQPLRNARREPGVQVFRLDLDVPVRARRIPGPSRRRELRSA